MNAAAYIWRGLSRLLLPIWHPLHLRQRTEQKHLDHYCSAGAASFTDTIAEQIAGGQALTVLAMGKALHEEFADLKVKIGHEPVPISDDDTVGSYESEGQDLDDLVALSITSLAALLVLFTELQH